MKTLTKTPPDGEVVRRIPIFSDDHSRGCFRLCRTDAGLIISYRHDSTGLWESSKIEEGMPDWARNAYRAMNDKAFLREWVSWEPIWEDRIACLNDLSKQAISPAAQLRAMRPVKPYACQQCGRSFQASDARARYCSNACRQRAKYQRSKKAK